MIYILTFILIVLLNKIWAPWYVKAAPNSLGLSGTFNRKKYCVVIGLWLFLLLFLRHAYVGSDTQNYYKVFRDIGTYGFSLELQDSDLSTEYGFYFLNFILNKYDLPFRCLIFISASFYIWSISYLIYKFSKSPAFSYFIFITFGFFIFNTTMRQCFALSFCIWSFVCLINGHRLFSIIFIICGVLFHSTAIVFIVALFVPYLKYNKKSFFLMLIAGIVIAASAGALYNTAGEMMGKNYEIKESTGYVSLIINVLLVLYGFLNRAKLTKYDRYWMYLIIISIILFPVASLNPALFRIRLYFSVFSIIYAANLSTIKTAHIQLFIVLLVSYGLYHFFIGNYFSGIRVLPYAFWWEDYYQLNPEIRELDLYPPD